MLFRSRLLQAFVDGGSAINLVHESIVSSLKIPVTPCVGPKVSLADGKATLSCNSFVVLSYILAGVSKRDTFFVFSIGAQAVILGMPWLEKVNPGAQACPTNNNSSSDGNRSNRDRSTVIPITNRFYLWGSQSERYTDR